MLNLHIQATDAGDLKTKIAGMADLSAFTTENLASELRERLACQQKVLKIVPFSADDISDESAAAIMTTTEGTTETPTPPKAPKPPKPPKLPKTATTTLIKPKVPTPPAPPPNPPTGAPDDPAEWENEVAEGKAEADQAETPEVTVDDVRAALDIHKNLCGLVTTRQVMAEVGGSSKLLDIEPAKLPALLARLVGDTKKAQANAAKNARGPDTRLKPKPDQQEAV